MHQHVCSGTCRSLFTTIPMRKSIPLVNGSGPRHSVPRTLRRTRHGLGTCVGVSPVAACREDGGLIDVETHAAVAQKALSGNRRRIRGNRGRRLQRRRGELVERPFWPRRRRISASRLPASLPAAGKDFPHGRSRQSSEGPRRTGGLAKRVDGRDRPCVLNAFRAKRMEWTSPAL